MSASDDATQIRLFISGLRTIVAVDITPNLESPVHFDDLTLSELVYSVFMQAHRVVHFLRE